MNSKNNDYCLRECFFAVNIKITFDINIKVFKQVSILLMYLNIFSIIL